MRYLIAGGALLVLIVAAWRVLYGLEGAIRSPTDYVIFVAIGYLLGSVPFGVIAGRVVGGVDVRQYGSGSTGTTNVLRTVGRRAAVAVLLLDMGKSVVAVLLARLLTDSDGVEVATALAAIAGHIWPVFAGFRGGKGISVGWSALFVLSPISGLVATLVGVPVIAVSRYVSLGSIIGSSLSLGMLVKL